MVWRSGNNTYSFVKTKLPCLICDELTIYRLHQGNELTAICKEHIDDMPKIPPWYIKIAKWIIH